MRDSPGVAFPSQIVDLMSSSAGRDVIVISREIDRELHYNLSTEIAANQRNKKCTVFLTTYGGDPNGGYRLARSLQHHYEHIRVVIPSFCKSAGTLIVIGAHEIAIGDLGELGPLDVQLRKNSELEERSSGLDIHEAISAVQRHAKDTFMRSLIEVRRASGLSTKLAGEFAAQLAIGITAPLYSQIDPNRLGEVQRAMRIAHDYATRLNEKTRVLRSGALDKLVAGYPAHGFVIDRKEAKTLFTCVTKPTVEEQEFIKLLWSAAFAEQTDFGPEFIRIDPSTPQGEPNDQINADSGENTADAAGAIGGSDGANNPGADGQVEPVRQDGGEAAEKRVVES